MCVQSENSQTLYEKLRRRVQAHQEAQVPPQPAETSDSPLLTMPTPPSL